MARESRPGSDASGTATQTAGEDVYVSLPRRPDVTRDVTRPVTRRPCSTRGCRRSRPVVPVGCARWWNLCSRCAAISSSAARWTA